MDQRELKLVLKLQDDASRELRRVTGDIDNAEQGTNRWSAAFGVLKTAALAAGTAIVGALGYGVKIAAELQTAEVGLKTLLGSAEAAKETIARLKIEAARTPFELPGLTQATQLLSSVTKDGNKSIDILLNVGEALAAMGKGQAELDRIIVNLQQVAAVGKASMIDIKQFAFAGIPIFEMLEDHFKSGVTAIADNSKEITKNGAELKKLQQQLKVASARQDEFTKNTSDATKMASRFKIAELKEKIANLSGTMSELNATNGQAVTGFTSVEDAIANGEVTFELLTELFDKANDEGGKFFNAYKNQAGTFTQAMSNMKDSFGIFMADIVNGTGIFQGLTNAMMLVANVLTNWRTILADVKGRISEFFADLEAKTGLVTFFQMMWENVVLMWEQRLKPALMELWEALKPLQPFIEALGVVLGATLVAAITILISALTGLAVLFVEILAKMTDVATFIFGSFGKAWDWITDKIAGVIEIVDKLISKFQKAIDLAAKVTSAVGKGFSSAVGALSGKASGGPVTGGTPYIVGEKGPELFVPSTSGNIIPNNAMGGGVTVNVYGDVSGQELIEKVQNALGMNIKRAIRV